MPSLTTTATVDSAGGPSRWRTSLRTNVDVVQLYDAFTINTILFLEDMGFCSKGEGGASCRRPNRSGW